MVITIPQIIAAVNPDRYFNGGEDSPGANSVKLKKFIGIIEEKKSENPDSLPLAYLAAINQAKAEGLLKTKSEISYKLTYDSPTETLEPIYFFILELMQDLGFDVEKMVDNFVSSPGSAHFGEMGQRANIMQQNGAKLLGDINTVLRSIITIVYDLRDFKVRLAAYEDLKSKDEETKKSARLSLKQIWLDKVDMQKGNSSVKAMAFGQSGFVTLLDAFLVVDNEKDVEKLDLNDIVKRILKPRIQEFNHWIMYSESELKKRFQIEKEYLRSQVSSLKTYVNWAKPYLKAADELRMSEGGRNPALVKMFNTIIFELTLLGVKKAGNFLQITLIDFDFRGIPQRTQQGYSAGGKTIMNFNGYLLSADELELVKDIFDKSEINYGLNLVEGITENSLGALTKDINFFLEDKEPEEDENKKDKKPDKPKDTSNPILALFGAYNNPSGKPSPSKQNKNKVKAKPEDVDSLKESVEKIFTIYKKAHGMIVFPD